MKSTIKNLLSVLILCSFVSQLSGQQFPYLNGLTDSRHIWNPADIAAEDGALVGLYARQQWIGLGFSTAPRYINAFYQKPFEDLNMSAGINLYSDKTGPTSSTGLTLQYAYHLQNPLGRYSRLSLGLNGAFSSFAFDPSEERFRDVDDPLLAGSRSSGFYPSMGAGFSFNSSTRKFRDNGMTLGFSVQQALSTNILVLSNNFTRQRHLYGYIGVNHVFRDSRLEPSISVSYTQPSQANFLLNFNYEKEDLFWTGLSFSSVSDLLFQGGFIVPDFNGTYGTLKIGAIGVFNIGDKLGGTGPGLELFISYKFSD